MTATITTTDTRTDLVGHTITVEMLDHATARQIGLPEAAGQLAAIERTDGRLGKICATAGDLFDWVTIEQTAAGIAHTYGARYIPTTPADRVVDGHGIQRISVVDANGTTRQVTYPGTVEDALTYIHRQATPLTDDEEAEIEATLNALAALSR